MVKTVKATKQDTLNKSRESIKKRFEKAGIDLNTKVNFWGEDISLKEIIPRLEKSDLNDARRCLDTLKEFRYLSETKKCPLCGKKIKEDSEEYLCEDCNFTWRK